MHSVGYNKYILTMSSKSLCLVVALKQQVWSDYPKMCVCVCVCGWQLRRHTAVLIQKIDVIILSQGRDGSYPDYSNVDRSFFSNFLCSSVLSDLDLSVSPTHNPTLGSRS